MMECFVTENLMFSHSGQGYFDKEKLNSDFTYMMALVIS